MTKNTLYIIALVLIIIGAVNWGLIGLINFNLVEAIFGFMPAIARIIYILVGVAAVYVAVIAFGSRTKI